VASVSTYWVLIITTLTGPRLHPPLAIVEKGKFFWLWKLKELSRVILEEKGLNWVCGKRCCVEKGLTFGIIYTIWVGCN